MSLFHKVYDLTDLLAENHGALARPILEAAGTDLTSWFDDETRDVKTHIDPVTNLEIPDVPMGRFVHVPPPEPVSTWKTDFGLPWWKDTKYCIGGLSTRTRMIRVVNTLTQDEHLLEVGSEETVAEIQDRYFDYNKHASSYVWKALEEGSFRPLDMEKTLADNGVEDETDELERLGIDPKDFIPVVHLYFRDDLTEA